MTRTTSALIDLCFEGNWKGSTEPGHDPQGRTLGILGMGSIGKAVAKRARAFGLNIQYHNRSPIADDEDLDAKYVSFDELISTSDILSLHLSFGNDREHVIARPQFDAMKDGVVLINTPRGKLVDEQALVDALKAGKVYSTGLDVVEQEPKVHPDLLENDKVILLPHIATLTFETRVSSSSGFRISADRATRREAWSS